MSSEVWAAGVALLVALAIAGCEVGAADDSSAPPAAVATSGRACSGVAKTAEPGAVPRGFPKSPDLVFFRVQKQGKTFYHLGHIGGSGVVEARDRLADDLRKAGFTVGAGDSEGNFEADTEFSGPREGSLRVTPLCEGRLQILVRYWS